MYYRFATFTVLNKNDIKTLTRTIELHLIAVSRMLFDRNIPIIRQKKSEKKHLPKEFFLKERKTKKGVNQSLHGNKLSIILKIR